GRNVEWVVAGGVTLRGTLFDQAGASIPDCDIWLMRTKHERPGYFDSTSRPERTARADASGRFVVASAESGRYWVGPSYPAVWLRSVRKDVAPLACVVDVTARDEIDVALHSACGLYVSGVVIPPADQPLLEGSVIVEDRERKLSMSSPWNADGTFTIGPLMDGSLLIRARSQSSYAPPEPLVVDAGSRTVKLELRASTSI